MPSAFPVWLYLVVTAGLMTASALFVPKGPHQVTIRTALMLTFSCCYLLWMITYMAQLNPMLAPVHSPKENH